jgi:phosphatidylglycerophosphate synthase
MDSAPHTGAQGFAPWMDLLWSAVVLAVLLALVIPPVASTQAAAAALATAVTVILYAAIVASVLTRWPPHQNFGWANRATLLRGCMIIVLVAIACAVAVGAELSVNRLWWYAAAALLALILDGVDGHLARRTNSASKFGARFDMELDALFILGLCLMVLAIGKAGAWVLALGLMRYGFVAAAWALPWMNQPLPPSFRRKTVCVWQVVTLMVAIVPPTPSLLVGVSLATALLLLTWSFFLDIYWLYQRRR